MNINTKAYIERFLKIKTKTAQIVPLEFNAPQMKLYTALAAQHKQGKPQRAIVLKARQMGFSTITEAIIFKRTATAKNVTSCIVAHIDTATTNLFNMFKLYYNKLPELLKPKKLASNAKEVKFNTRDGEGLNSLIKCYTAGGTGIGRSDTINNLHVSELAYWEGNKEETLQGLMQAVPNLANTLVVIESTAKGFDLFKELWDKAVAGLNDFTPVFCAWWELDEYRMPYNGFELTKEELLIKATYRLHNDQLTWRRWCITNNCNDNMQKFKQEYPACPEEAFSSSTGTYFSEFNLGLHVCTPFAIPAYWKWYFTMDYGGDMAAFYWIAVDEKNNAYVVKEFCQGRDNDKDPLLVSDAAMLIADWTDTPVTAYLAPPDMWNTDIKTGRCVADIFADSGLYLTKTNNDRVAGWLAVKEWLKPYVDIDGETKARLQIFNNCKQLIKCLPALQYDEKKPSDVAINPHEITHSPDALRGFCVYWTTKAEVPIKNSVYKKADMQEDWKNGTNEIRRIMEERYGKPY